MKKFITLFLTTAMLTVSCSAFAKDYSDYPQKFWDLTKEHWAYAAISELTDKKIINGFSDGSFKPNSTITRAEWTKIMVTALNIPIGEQDMSDIYDVSSDDWFYQYVGASKPYMNFYNIDGKKYFKPNQAASREDVTVSLVKMKGYSVDDVDYSYLNKFSDLDSISNNLKRYVTVAVEKNLIDGFDDGTFRGQDTLTRAEAATLLCRAFQIGDDNKTVGNEETPEKNENGGGEGGENSKKENTVNPPQPQEPQEPQFPQDKPADDIKIFLDGTEIDTDYMGRKPLLENEFVYCPMRTVSEVFGLSVAWDSDTQTVMFEKEDKKIVMQVDNSSMYVDAKKIDIGVPCCKIVDNYTLVNLNMLCAPLGYVVKCEGNTVNIVPGEAKLVPPEKTPDSTPEKNEPAASFSARTIDTLCDAHVKDIAYRDYLIYSGGRFIFYIDTEDNIYQIDTKTEKNKFIINLKDISVFIESKNYKICEFSSLYYDKKEQQLMCIADMESTGYVQSDLIRCATFSLPDCKYKGRAVDRVAKEGLMRYSRYRVFGMLNNGKNLLSVGFGAIGTPPLYNDITAPEFAWDEYTTFAEDKGNIYFCSDRYIKKYDYKGLTDIMSVSNYTAHTATERGIFLMDATKLIRVGFDGEIQNELDYNDITVNDYKPFNVANIAPTLYWGGNKNVVFYDMSCKCFRIIHTGF